MSRRRLVSLTFAGIAALIAVPASVRSVAQRKAPNPQAVRVLDAAGVRAQSGTDKGGTYSWLEGQATRVTTKFRDAVAVTERLPDGDSRTTVTDLGGNQVATFKVDRNGAANNVLEFRTPDANSVVAAGRADLAPTLDWGNRQAYSLWKDLGRRPDSSLEWQDDLMRSAGSPKQQPGDVLEVRTDWPDGISATAVKTVGVRRHVLTDKPGYGHTFRSRLTRNAGEIGSIRWDVEEQLLTWSFPGLTEGYVDPSRLARIGGWTFTPDMAWVNIQSFAFQHFHTLIQTQGFVAKRREAWVPKLVGFFVPTVTANEQGCDGLHWLDNSIFRPCCDIHDACYEAYGCDSSSWWRWWSSWTCDYCNYSVAYCFATGGEGPYHQTP